MPTKRRRRRSKRQKLNACERTESSLHAELSGDTRTKRTTTTTAVCAVCRRQNTCVIITCPCSHKVCELCLQTSAASDGNDVNCPACSDTPLASKASYFIGKVQNLWLSATAGKEADRVAQNCTVHSQHAVEFWCLPCDVRVCPLCKLAEHEGHQTKSISLLAAEARHRVTDAGNERLRHYEDRLQAAVEDTKERREVLNEMGQDVLHTIHKRHARLLCIIDEQRDSALLELEAMAVEAESSLDADEVRLHDELNVLAGLQHRVEQSVGDTDPSSVLLLDRELETAWGSDDIMVRRSKALPAHTYTLEHGYSTVNANAEPLKKTFPGTLVNKLKKCINQFIGHATKTKTLLLKMSLDMTVTPLFRCCKDPDAFVLSVCPIGAEKLAVSYSTSPDRAEGVTKSFFENGLPSKSFNFGLCTLMSSGNGMFHPCPYSKKQMLGMTLRLIWSKSENKSVLVYYPGTGWTFRSLFDLPAPFCKIFGRCLPASLRCPEVDAVAPLSFDATKDGALLAIVDVRSQSYSPLDNNLGKTDRVVKLISYSGDYTSTDDYVPPTQDFLPSDVCFFSLQGQTVLLVSDMGANSIHVLTLSPRCVGEATFHVCQFQRYLVADCERMQQPTALNTDEKGRLWVACKGGQLLTVEPAT